LILADAVVPAAISLRDRRFVRSPIGGGKGEARANEVAPTPEHAHRVGVPKEPSPWGDMITSKGKEGEGRNSSEAGSNRGVSGGSFSS